MKKLIIFLVILLILITGCSNKINSSDEVDKNTSNSDNVVDKNDERTEDVINDEENVLLEEESKEEVTKDLVKSLYKVPNQIGNIAGNLIYDGICAEQGDYIFFNSHFNAENSYLCRAKKDGSEIIKFVEGVARRINVIGDWVYFQYTPRDYRSGIYKIKIDGTELTKLYDKSPSEMVVKDNWIYFLNRDIYKMSIDGGEVIKIREEDSNSSLKNLNITDDWLYFSFGTNLRRINLDGSKEQFVGHGMLYPIVDDNTIYYLTYRGSEVAKVDILNNPINDGDDVLIGNEIILHDGQNEYLNVYGDWLYFDTWHGSKVYKIKKDGTDLTMINDEKNFVLLNVVEDWIYYVNYDEDKSTYKMRMDGSENQPAM